MKIAMLRCQSFSVRRLMGMAPGRMFPHIVPQVPRWTSEVKAFHSDNSLTISQLSNPHPIHARSRSRQFSSDANPLVTIQQAMTSLDDFANQLNQLAQQVDETHVIIVSQGPAKSISLAEIALHSRDASWKEFHSPLAVTAREKLLVQAQKVETQLRSMVDYYVHTIQPQMEESTKLCQETPCGGATWELDLSKLQEQAQSQNNNNDDGDDKDILTTTQGNQRVVLKGEHGTLDGTPCGRLQVKSMEFLETTRYTKPQILMASRARILLSLAMELNAPLQDIRKNGTREQKQLIQSTFASQVIPTPWIRSDEEYQALTSIRQGFSQNK